jgi:hypothetical protein
MEHVERWLLLPVALGLLVAAACSRSVAGIPTALPDGTGPPPAAAPAAAAPPTAVPPTAAIPGSGTVTGGPSPSAAPVRATTLQPDVLADECLLDATQLGALLGRPARAEQAVVQRPDGTRGASCYVAAVDGPQAPSAAMNVYRVRSGTPAQFVQAAGGRPLVGVGEAATLLETATGPTLQVASPAYLITLVVHGRSPPDDAWRAAARAALARLPG